MRYSIIGLIMSLVAACGTNAAPMDMVTTEIIGTATPAPIAQAPTLLPSTTPTLVETPTPGPTVLSVWWPESFAPQDNNEAVTVLSEQVNGFQATQGNVVVNMRLKKESDLGGIMSTLLTASAVAPGALPDLTLIRRSDLLNAVRSGLIYPLEGKISSAVVGDLYDAALQLGQVDETLYGVPYTLEIQHTAYQMAESLDLWSFANLLENEISFVFPAGQPDGINDVFLAQYMEAGGTLPAVGDELNEAINEQALLETLSFYENARTNGLLDADVVNYTLPANYLDLLVSGGVDAGVVTSTAYLKMLQNGANLDFAPMPTVSGELITEVDGWIWVLTTPNADRQVLAAQFLNWMLNANRQGDYTQVLQMLPSQRTALQRWESTPYNAFARDLLANAILPLASTGAQERAMQNALVSVLTGQSTAQEATDALMNQLAAAN
jgi:ABC-type glycerol-3-phosphate transport system substrate-binding protein